jgi:hypothetical protein
MSRDDQTRGRGFLRTKGRRHDRRRDPGSFDWRTVKPSRLGRKDRRRLGSK